MLSPHFDDALYQLAMADSQSADYQSALNHLRSMQIPQGPRRYGYFSTLADALTELNLPGAVEAANQAFAAAQNENDRQQARRTAYIAATDLTVQFTTDAQGRRKWSPLAFRAAHAIGIPL